MMLWAEIDLDKLKSNLKTLCYLAGEGKKVIPVLKANAYGHGAVEVARCLEKCGVMVLAVDDVSEGQELREAGITASILLLNDTLSTFANSIIKYDLIPTVYNLQMLEVLDRLGRDGSPIKVQVRVDINKMGLGVKPEDLPHFISELKRCQGLKIDGVFTHLLGGYYEDYEVLDSELKRFNKMINSLDIHVPNVHAASSPAIIMKPKHDCNFVRSGTALYGLPSFANKHYPELEPVLEIKTRILRVELYENELNGYKNNTLLHGKRKIAVLPFGYGDIPYYLMMKEGQVLIRGQRCSVIGKPCMSHTLVDVSHLSVVKVGDEVVILGKQHSERIKCEELAEKVGLPVLNCEGICFIDRNIPRKYIGRSADYKHINGSGIC